jgi:DNA-binding FadR family transcriptional regulator
LARDILSGALLPGEQLPTEAVLLERMGVSRTTLREGIKILEAKGMVTRRPKVGTTVRPAADWRLLDPDVLGWLFSGGDLEGALVELFDVRRMIETEAAALAADTASRGQVSEIAAAYQAMEGATSLEAALEADVAFHKAIIHATNNRFMTALATVSETALRATVRLSVRRPGGLPHSLPQHAAVLQAIAERNPKESREAMKHLILSAQSDTIAVARERRRADLSRSW